MVEKAGFNNLVGDILQELTEQKRIPPNVKQVLKDLFDRLYTNGILSEKNSHEQNLLLFSQFMGYQALGLVLYELQKRIREKKATP